MPLDRRQFLKTSFAALAAGRAAQGKGQLHALVPSQQSEVVLDAHLKRYPSGSLRKPRKAEADKLLSILNDLHNATATLDTEPVNYTPDVRLCVMRGHEVRFKAEIVKCGESASGALIVTEGALDILPRDMLEAGIAHEESHRLAYLNARLREDKRFVPVSRQFAVELAQLQEELQHHHFLTREEEKEQRSAQDPAEYIERKRRERVEHFTVEALSDKLGVWLTGKPQAMRDLHRLLHARLHNDAAMPDADLPQPSDGRRPVKLYNPYPSFEARTAEVNETARQQLSRGRQL